MSKSSPTASNPYVYPSDNFTQVGRPVRATILEPRICALDDIKLVLDTLLPPLDLAVLNTASSSAEQIFAALTSGDVCFGDVQNVLQDKQDWLTRIEHFTIQNTPIMFTIHGFPFKMPVPVKTNRHLPDLGDYASLASLNRLMKTLSAIYAPGAELTVICEGGFAQFMGLETESAEAYQAQLSVVSDKLDFSHLQFVAISDMEKYADYINVFKTQTAEFANSIAKGDPKSIKRYESVFPILFRIVSSERYADQSDALCRLYNASADKASLQELAMETPLLKEMISDISARTDKAITAYFAYLKTRDELKYVEKVAPFSLPLSVSPKPGRLGVYPINASLSKLPYHAVPVVANETLDLQYLYDLMRTPAQLTPVHLADDADTAPLYYEQ